MARIFISADIEGTTGIAHWDETEIGHPGYDRFQQQMSREVAAAVEGIHDAASDNEVFIKDAHDSARNLLPMMLPQRENVKLFRGWGRDPYSMMSGIDETFDGAMFTGYHSAVGWNGNPLSHTMNGQNYSIRLNGEVMSELMMNSITAAMFKVPVLLVAGDKMLCDWMKTKVPEIITVPVNEGVGAGCISLMPQQACRLIREGAYKAAAMDPVRCMYPMPEHFRLEVEFKEHTKAKSGGWYPGAYMTDSRTVVYESDNWMDVLTFMHFCL